MSETQKPFACAREGCEMAFTNEDHLNVHKKKHDMALHLGIDNQNNSVVADQTPTPTRFIRNCEEVGLFQDLQNVNPFDETFRKAAELAKTGLLHVPDSSSDDTLHTPHIFPHIEAEHNLSKFSRNNSNEPEFIVTTLKEDDLLKLNKNSDDFVVSEAESSEEPEVLSVTEESDQSDDLETGKLFTHGNTVISKDSLISNNAPTAIPVPTSIANSEALPAVVNNLSDIQINTNVVRKKNCLSRVENGEERIKCKIKEALKNRVKTEESESGECDTIIMATSARLRKPPQKRVFTKHSVKESPKSKSINYNTSKPRHILTSDNTQNINAKPTAKNLPALSQSQIDRQREVNRAAQNRSREKKKYWINQMETEIVLLKDEKKELWLENQNLKNEIIWLKTMLLYHKDCPVARDPQIMEEINMLVKTSQMELQKKEEPKPPPKKIVPIWPNPTSVIALTPITNSMLVQIPTPITAPVLAPHPTIPPLVSEVPKNVVGVTITPLPVLKAKPSAPLAVNETNTPMPKLLPGLPPSSTQNLHRQNSSSPDSPPRLVIADDVSPPSYPPESNIVKAKDKLETVRKKGKRLGKLRTHPSQIIRLPNSILPDDNYFILTTANEIKNKNLNTKHKPD